MVSLLRITILEVIAYITIPLGILANLISSIQEFISPVFTLLLSIIGVITGILVIINWCLKNRKLRLEIKEKEKK